MRVVCMCMSCVCMCVVVCVRACVVSFVLYVASCGVLYCVIPVTVFFFCVSAFIFVGLNEVLV